MRTAFLTVLALLPAGLLTAADRSANDSYAVILRAHGIEPTPKGVFAYVRPLTDEQLQTLIRRLGDRDYATRRKAMEYLASLPTAPLSELERATESSDPEVRVRAAVIIRRSRQGKHVNVLHAALKTMRGKAYADAAPILIDMMPHFHREILIAAASEALANIVQPEHVELLRRTLRESSHTQLRIAVVRSLATLGERDVLSDLRTAAADKDERVRLAAAAALLKFDDHGGLEPLAELLSSEDVEIRAGASWYLRKATGRHFGYLAIDKSPAKDRSAKAWKDWVRQHGETATLHSTDGVAFLSNPTVRVKATLLRKITGHASTVYCVAFSPDGKTIASCSGDCLLKLWNIADGNEIWYRYKHASTVRSVAFSPDGKLLATGSYDKTLKIWDAKTGKVLRTLTGHTSSVRLIAFSPDGKRLASASSDATVRVWDVATGRTVLKLGDRKDKNGKVIERTGHESTVRGVAFSPDGKLLASCSSDRTIKLWLLTSGKLLKTLTGHRSSVRSVAFTPDGQTLVSGSLDNTVRMWDVQSGAERVSLTGHTSSVKSVDMSADGRFFVSGGNDNTVRIWDAGSTKLVATLRGPTSMIWHVAISRDGKMAAACGTDRSVYIWKLDQWNALPPAAKTGNGAGSGSSANPARGTPRR